MSVIRCFDLDFPASISLGAYRCLGLSGDIQRELSVIDELGNLFDAGCGPVGDFTERDSFYFRNFGVVPALKSPAFCHDDYFKQNHHVCFGDSTEPEYQ